MQCNSFTNIRIILVGTTHPGNIGATARAMKTMEQARLCLVNPKYFPHADASARAAGADDILAQSETCDSLLQAVADCQRIYATSTRPRSLTWPVMSPRACAADIMQYPQAEIALVFGRENSGLSNEELDLCDAMVQIPTNPNYRSLNLAQAVQILCYEIWQSRHTLSAVDPLDKPPLATQQEQQMLYQHLQNCMTQVGFFDPAKPRRLMRRMKRLFSRAELEQNECNILRGFLAAIQDSIDSGEQK